MTISVESHVCELCDEVTTIVVVLQVLVLDDDELLIDDAANTLVESVATNSIEVPIAPSRRPKKPFFKILSFHVCK